MLAAQISGNALTDFRYRVTMVSKLGRKHVSLCGLALLRLALTVHQPLDMIGPSLERCTLLSRELVSLIDANDAGKGAARWLSTFSITAKSVPSLARPLATVRRRSCTVHGAILAS